MEIAAIAAAVFFGLILLNVASSALLERRTFRR